MELKNYARQIKLFFEQYRPSRQFTRSHIKGMLVGSIVTASISLLLWSLAYFGFIDLGLPKRFDFEITSKTIERELPENYSYRTISLNNFRITNTETLIVLANYNNWLDYKDVSTKSDIVLFLDRKADKYELSFKYQPSSDSPLHIKQFKDMDIDSDGTKELIVSFAYMGAHWSPGTVTVFSSKEGVKVFEAKEGTGKLNVNKHASATSEFFIAKQGSLAIINRNYNSCSACGEEDTWYIEPYTFNGNELIPSQNEEIKRFRGFSHLEKYIDENKYSNQ